MAKRVNNSKWERFFSHGTPPNWATLQKWVNDGIGVDPVLFTVFKDFIAQQIMRHIARGGATKPEQRALVKFFDDTFGPRNEEEDNGQGNLL